MEEFEIIIQEKLQDYLMTIRRPVFYLCLAICVTFAIYPLQAQSQDEELTYDERVALPYLNGVYIPADEEQAVAEILRLAEQSGLDKFKSGPEEVVRRKLHFGLGKWIAQNWQLWAGSRLSDYLKKKGVSHPDDMVEYLIIYLHRTLNDVPIQEEKLINEFKAKRRAIYEEMQKRKKENQIILDTLD